MGSAPYSGQGMVCITNPPTRGGQVQKATCVAETVKGVSPSADDSTSRLQTPTQIVTENSSNDL